MILEAALVIGGLVTTIAIGGPIASSLVRPHLFRRAALRDMGDGRDRPVHASAFEPLDLGPDPVDWPSKKSWTSSKRLDAEWPSQRWEDEHFGSHWRDHPVGDNVDSGFHAMAQREYDAAAELADGGVEPPKKSREAASRRRAPDRPARPTPPGRGVRRKQATPKPAAETLPARQAPSRAELEDLIARVGLAGTVQEIMGRTGWDFRKAAHYLARTRQYGDG